jgi:hypothetical protein
MIASHQPRFKGDGDGECRLSEKWAVNVPLYCGCGAQWVLVWTTPSYVRLNPSNVMEIAPYLEWRKTVPGHHAPVTRKYTGAPRTRKPK